MPDSVRRLLSSVRVRWFARSVLLSIAAGGAVYGAATAIDLSITAAWLVAAVVGVMTLAAGGSLSLADAADLVESRAGTLDNLIVTAAELEWRPRAVRPELLDEIRAQADQRIVTVDPARIIPIWQPLVVASFVVIGCALLARSPAPSLAPATETEKGSGIFFSVRVTPPAYTNRRVENFRNPIAISAIAGSRIQIETTDKRVLRDWVATESEGVEIEIIPDPFSRKFLSVNVLPDAPPTVRIAMPGRDTAFPTPAGRLEIDVQSNDDLGLAALSLHLTKATGGGESMSFTESQVPLQVERRDGQHWTAKATLSLASLNLAEGDMVVYRAIARDTNPLGTAVQSEQYLIEIGKNAEIADAGFALPSEEKKYAISQQMVIYKTEQLIARRRQSAAGGQLAESRDLAIEQRMVRAEVVFLGGGEVEDEVEEAAHSHELAEGRLQNTGRIEMLRAINAMSRAEAHLNDGRLAEALVFERQALASLERALDRRRYFLRTLPDRSRIDATRRLIGDRREARSWDRAPAAAPPPTLAAHRQLIKDLAAGATVDAGLAARITAIDPSSLELQKAAVALVAAATEASRKEAVEAAMAALTTHALSLINRSASVDLRTDSLAGQLATELARPRQ